MKIIFIAVMVSSFVFSSCAQSRHNIISAKAFYQEKISGVAIADDNGQVMGSTPDTLRWLIIECKGTERPVIDSVFFFGKVYTPNISSLHEYPILTGKRKSDGKDAVISTRPGNSLWRVELTLHAIDHSFKGSQIVLTGIASGKRFWMTVKTVMELEAEIRG